jgi:hypothetical protein
MPEIRFSGVMNKFIATQMKEKCINAASTAGAKAWLDFIVALAGNCRRWDERNQKGRVHVSYLLHEAACRLRSCQNGLPCITMLTII